MIFAFCSLFFNIKMAYINVFLIFYFSRYQKNLNILSSNHYYSFICNNILLFIAYKFYLNATFWRYEIYYLKEQLYFFSQSTINININYQTPYFFNFFLLNFLFCVGIQLINNVVVVLGEQGRDSIIQIPIYILPQTSLPSSLPHNIEQSSIYYTVGLCWLSLLNIAVCT